ncbi:hypothetical protein D3874_12375 [Oleomonas cavernae]|uniref:Uncharacterized protein n=1 Tax=Oleomonas cavernae TaxID=2320859 RepID=A0A418WCK4_9PROT|nr:hypothetical protein [Oleomonas cavernae]RJF87720.1 hypothetical protein D3874_12375 [Oleomonas cavernae]
MNIRAILSSTALVSTMAMATFAASQDTTQPDATQEAVAVSGEQFGYSGKAVAETNGQLSIFGGQDENGGLYGGAPSLTIPLGDSLGLQIDGIAGFVADEVGFAGGAAQLFYRDPQKGLIGVAGGGYYIEGDSQYAVSAIGEYYLETVTLEATVGYLTGDIIDGEVYGRVGLSIYTNPNLRIGAGLTYYETAELGGDVTVEALLTDVPGLALFATGAFDDAGALGYGGVRFYFNSGTNLMDTDRAKQAAEPTLIGMHRNLGRQNFFLSDPTGFGLRQISRAGGAKTGGDPFGDITPPPPPPPPGSVSHGLIDTVQNTVDGLLGNSPLAPVDGLVDTLVDPITGALSPVTDPLNDLTDTETGPLGPLTGGVDTLIDALSPVLDPLAAALSGGAAPTDALPLGSLTSALEGTPLAPLGDALSGGLPTDALSLDTLTSALEGTPLAPLGDALSGLPIPGASGGDSSNPLAGVPVLGDVVGTLMDAAGGGLPIPGAGGDSSNPLAGVPVLGDVVGTLMDAAGGGLPIPGAGGGDSPLASIPVVGDLLGGLPIPGVGGDTGSNPLAGIPVLGDLAAAIPSNPSLSGGLIDNVQNTVDGLLVDTPLVPVADGVTTLVDPVTGALAPLTGPLNDATEVPDGPGAPLTQVVDALVGTQAGALDPVLDAVHDLLSGQVPSLPGAGGGDSPLASIPVLGDALGSLPIPALPIPGLPGAGGGDNPLAGVPVLGDLVGTLSGAASGGLPIPGLPGAGGDSPLTGIPVLGDLAGTLTSLPSALSGLAGGGLPLPI